MNETPKIESMVRELRAIYKQSYASHDWNHVIEVLKIVLELCPHVSEPLQLAANEIDIVPAFRSVTKWNVNFP